MKKIISLILMIAILISVSAFAEGDFTLHSGVKFGMSLNEVRTCESENGFTLEKYLSGNTYNTNSGKIAGLDSSRIYYSFDGDKLVQAKYEFPTGSDYAYNQSVEESKSDYAKISDLLNEKYGISEYNTLTGKIYAVSKMIDTGDAVLTCSSFGEHDLWKQSDRAWANTDYTTISYEEWLIEQPDGSGIYIHHCLYKNANNDANETLHKIYYTIFDAEIISSIQEATESASSDL